MPRVQARQAASQASFLVFGAFLSVFRHELSVIKLYISIDVKHTLYVLYLHLCLVQLHHCLFVPLG